jgi:ABC-2 type transport system ATP-binding protein
MENKIIIKNLTKKIRGTVILDDINLELTGGKVYGVSGKYGCGKTMLMRSICGLIKPTSGEVVINEKVLGKDMSFPESLGALIENPAFLGGYTGFDNLRILADIKGGTSDEQIKESLTKVGLDPDDKRKYRKYSLGMKQKLGIACAIMENPDVVILDEPINAIDEKGVKLIEEVLNELREQGKIILIACHDKEELELLADEIFYMEEGKMA